MDLTTAIGNALLPSPPTRSEQGANLYDVGLNRPESFTFEEDAGGAAAAVRKPVFQITALPMTLDLKAYTNAKSNVNPNGSPLALRAFRDLVDPVPTFNRYYTAGTGSTESYWGSFVNGASGNSSFAREALSGAKEKFANSRLSGTLEIPDPWRPVFATPHNWYDLSADRFTPIEINLEELESNQGNFVAVQDANHQHRRLGETLRWRIDDRAKPRSVELSPDTVVKAVRFKALEVVLRRPWLDYSLFSMRGLVLEGLDAGYLSSGRLDDNSGILPLYPTSFYLARDIEIEGEWSDHDRRILNTAQKTAQGLALGHFALNSGTAPGATEPASELTLGGNIVESSAVQVIGWVSALVPLCPRV